MRVSRDRPCRCQIPFYPKTQGERDSEHPKNDLNGDLPNASWPGQAEQHACWREAKEHHEQLSLPSQPVVVTFGVLVRNQPGMETHVRTEVCALACIRHLQAVTVEITVAF